MEITEGQAGFFWPACRFICTAKRPVSEAWNSRGESGIAAPCLLPDFNAFQKSAFSLLLVEQCGCMGYVFNQALRKGEFGCHVGCHGLSP